MKLELRNASMIKTPTVAVCNVDKGEDVAWFFKLHDAEEYIKLHNEKKFKKANGHVSEGE